jgi:hypothetical protein
LDLLLCEWNRGTTKLMRYDVKREFYEAIKEIDEEDDE